MFCIYCGQEKDNSEQSKEHIIPEGIIGGGLTPTNPFMTRSVCKKCNNLSGRYVDGPFIKNWFFQNYRYNNALKHVNLKLNPVVPIVYQGELQKSFLPNRVCEFWLGPTGDSIFYFRTIDFENKNDWGSTEISLGRCTKNSYRDFAFLFIRARNPEWWPCVIQSTIKCFKGITLYLGNESDKSELHGFAPIPLELVNLRDDLLDILRKGEGLELNFQLNIGFEERFLGKLALGLGSIFLKPEFICSRDAQKLRDLMWEKEFQKRASILIRGRSFFSEDWSTREKQVFSWSGGHIILFMPVDQCLWLITCFYGKQLAAIEVCSNPLIWEDLIDLDGTVYVISPSLKKFVGPISLHDYIAAKTGFYSREESELANFFAEADALDSLPPFDLDV